MNSAFGLYSRYYDLLYRDKDYAGETAYIRSLIDRFAPATRDVLEFGSGTGKHARLLAQTGLSVTGVEQSAEMIAAAEQQSEAEARGQAAAPRTAANSVGSATIVHGDARRVRLDRQFDLVLALFHVVSYQINDDDVAAMFETAAVHLRRGGLFVFDLWYGPAVLHLKPDRRVKEMEDQHVQVIRIAQPTTDTTRHVVEVQYDIKVTDKSSGQSSQFSETHPMRYFFTAEIERFAAAANMQVIHHEQWMDGAEPSPQTWGVTFVLRINN